jgi:hypothetical protein
MRNLVFLAAATAATIAMPASAQLVGGSAKANANAGAQVDTGRALGGVLDSADRTATRAVKATDRLATRTINGTNVSLVTRSHVTAGTEVRDSRGQRIGTVSRLDGNAAVVVSGQRAYHVPLTQLYRRTTGTARFLVTSVPRAQLTGHANAKASANSAAHAGH